MSTNTASIFDAAMNLPSSDRASLAFQLLQSLRPSSAISEQDDDFDAILERRAADYDAGGTSAADWNDVATRLRIALEKQAHDDRSGHLCSSLPQH
jgi:putative addiction module component (TIGR02574 family)